MLIYLWSGKAMERDKNEVGKIKLSTLKKLLQQLKLQIKDYTSQTNDNNEFISGEKAEQLALATENLTLYLADTVGSPFNASSSPFVIAQQKYFETLGNLEDTVKQVESYITEAENKGITDNDEVTDIFPSDYVKNYNSLVSNYISLIKEIDKFYLDNHEPGTLFVGSENFVPPPALQFILETTSGKFNLATCNAKLAQSKHTTLDVNAMNEGFYKDHDASSFTGQSVKEAGRNASHSSTLKKCEDFVDLYLKETQFPAEIKPNLMALISTLAYQSGIQGITHDTLLNTVYGVFTGQGGHKPGVASIATGGTDKLSFWFDADKNLCIQALGNVSPVIFDNGSVFSGESKANIIKSTNIKIKVECNANKEPTFTLDTFDQTVSCFLGKNASDVVQWGVKKNNISEYNYNSVDQKHFTILEGTVENLVKFAGYTSTEDWAKKHGRSTATAIFYPEFYTYDLGKTKRSPDIGLTPKEIQLIDQLYQGFYKDHATPEQMAKHITNFVVNALPTLSASDKVRYLNLLKMAASFGGSDLKEVRTAYSALLDSLAADKPTLLAALKTDINLYALYQEKTSGWSWFSNLPKFSENEHQSILTALKDELPTFIAENPAYIKGNTEVLSFLNKSSVEEKIRFLSHYAKNTPETLAYLDKAFFNFDKAFDFDKSPNLYKAMTHLIITGNTETVKELRTRLPQLFDAYNWAQFDKGTESVAEKIALLQKVDDPIGKFGTNYIAALTNHLQMLCEKKLSEGEVLKIGAFIEYLAGVLVQRKSDRASKMTEVERKEIDIYLGLLSDTYKLHIFPRIQEIKSAKIEEIKVKEIPEKKTEIPTSESEISVKFSAQKKEEKEGSPIEKAHAKFTKLFSEVKKETETLSSKIESESSASNEAQPEEEVKRTKTPGK
jgi:hypothetical protein